MAYTDTILMHFTETIPMCFTESKHVFLYKDNQFMSQKQYMCVFTKTLPV